MTFDFQSVDEGWSLGADWEHPPSIGDEVWLTIGEGDAGLFIVTGRTWYADSDVADDQDLVIWIERHNEAG